MLTELSLANHRGSRRALWSLLSFSPFIMRVPSCLGGLPKSPVLPEGLSWGQKGNWSEMASHILAILPEFSSLATLCLAKAWPATLLFSPALAHVTCARRKCYLGSSMKALVWLAVHPLPLKNMKPSLSSTVLACFKRSPFPFFSSYSFHLSMSSSKLCGHLDLNSKFSSVLT